MCEVKAIFNEALSLRFKTAHWRAFVYWQFGASGFRPGTRSSRWCDWDTIGFPIH
jgi:hypothetical protein